MTPLNRPEPILNGTPEDDHFFSDLLATFEELREKKHLLHTSGCPSQVTLRAYVLGDLSDELHFDGDEHQFLKFLAGEPALWTKSEVSLHSLVCDQCASCVRETRAHYYQKPMRMTSYQEKKFRLELPWRAMLASAAVVLLIFIGLSQLDDAPPTSGVGGASILVYRPGR
jgi:hypothetical protein